MRDGSTLVPDEEGSELDNLEAARAEALSVAAEMLAERIRTGRTIGYRTFEIADATGEIVMSVPFRMALKLD